MLSQSLKNEPPAPMFMSLSGVVCVWLIGVMGLRRRPLKPYSTLADHTLEKLC